METKYHRAIKELAELKATYSIGEEIFVRVTIEDIQRAGDYALVDIGLPGMHAISLTHEEMKARTFKIKEEVDIGETVNDLKKIIDLAESMVGKLSS